MPRLLLLRHAKAENAKPGVSDHDRALTKAGREQSTAVGSTVAGRGPVDLVLSSTALRAKETWDFLSPTLDTEPEVRLSRAIYDAGDSYLSILNAEGGDAATILLVGHNPTMHATAVSLVSGLAGPDGAVLASRFPKAAIAVIDFSGSWEALRPGRAQLSAFILPGSK